MSGNFLPLKRQTLAVSMHVVIMDLWERYRLICSAPEWSTTYSIISQDVGICCERNPTFGSGNFKEFLIKFWRVFKEILKHKSCLFPLCFNEPILSTSRKFQMFFNKDVLFVILLLHGSHRRYLNRRRACFIQKLKGVQKKT